MITNTRVEIDRTACAGHGLCYSTAPEILDCDDQGDPVVMMTSIPDHLRELAQRIVGLCPEKALTLKEDPSSPSA